MANFALIRPVFGLSAIIQLVPEAYLAVKIAGEVWAWGSRSIGIEGTHAIMQPRSGPGRNTGDG